MAVTGPIAVYGATGYTGRLVVAELARRELEIVVAGRDPVKLRAVEREVAPGATIRPAEVDDAGALRHAIGDCAAVINVAGPFSRIGEPVVRAAIETGTHYVDTTGEQGFMARLFERFQDAAHAAEVAVVPGIGFDYLPGDLLCHLVARDREPVRELVVAYHVAGMVPTRGTLRSVALMMRGDDVEYVDGDWRPAGVLQPRGRFTFPEPIGSQAVARYPSGEVVTVPRHVDVRRVVSRIATEPLLRVPGAGELVPLVAPLLALALRSPLRAGLDALAGRLPEGPGEQARRAARFTIVALAHGEDGRTGRGVARGGDIYGLTAVTAVHGAELIAAPGYDRTGVLAPARAFDARAFLDHLAAHGVSYELD